MHKYTRNKIHYKKKNYKRKTFRQIAIKKQGHIDYKVYQALKGILKKIIKRRASAI